MKRPSYYKYSTLMQRPSYKKMAETGLHHLDSYHYVSFETMLMEVDWDVLQLDAATKSKTFEPIREYINRMRETELIPVVQEFFDDMATRGLIPIDDAGQYTPGGRGKATAGWLLPKPEMKEFVSARQARRTRVMNGIKEAYNSFGEVARKNNVRFNLVMQIKQLPLFKDFGDPDDPESA